MFISLGGRDPGPASAPCVRASNNMLSHMPFPIGVLDLFQHHSRAACPWPAQHVPWSCCKHRHNYARAKPTAMELLHSTDPHSTSSAVLSLSSQPAQLPSPLLAPRCVSPGTLARKPARPMWLLPLSAEGDPFLHTSVNPALYLVLLCLCINLFLKT